MKKRCRRVRPFGTHSRLIKACFLLLCLLFASCSTDTPKPLHIGAGPGLPRLFADALVHEWNQAARATLASQAVPASQTIQTGQPLSGNHVMQAAQVFNTEMITRQVGDCCAAVSQWGLSSRELDMAVMCPDAARTLLEKNSDYLLLGPILLDGDMLVRRAAKADNIVNDVSKSNTMVDTASTDTFFANTIPAAHISAAAAKPVRTVGVSHQRSAQKALAREAHPLAEIIEMLPASLPYALEREVVDAVVLDVLLAQQLPVLPERVGKTSDKTAQSRPSQVLVIHQRLANAPDLHAVLRRAVDHSNGQLAALLNENKENIGWIKPLTKFVSPLVSASSSEGAGAKPPSGD